MIVIHSIQVCNMISNAYSEVINHTSCYTPTHPQDTATVRSVVTVTVTVTALGVVGEY